MSLDNYYLAINPKSQVIIVKKIANRLLKPGVVGQNNNNKRGGNNKYNMKKCLGIPYFGRVNNPCEELRELNGKKTT